MPQFGWEHLGVLVVIAVVAVVLVASTRRARGTDGLERALTLCGWAMLAISALWSVYWLLPAQFDIDQSLPFHFSDAMRYLAAIALITRSGWAVAVLYYWGLTLNLQSILTPDLNYLSVPWLEFVMYWVLHGAVLVVPIVLTWGLGLAPTWRGYGVAFGATAAWSGLAFAVNVLIGSNYGYMNGAPEGRSILDLLGPWPVYIAWEGVLILSVWALITWPWVTRGSRGRTEPVGRLGLVRRAAD